MLPADYPFALQNRPRSLWRPRLLRVFGIAISLAVHAGVLLHLLAPVPPMPTVVRALSTSDQSLQIILLDTPAPKPPTSDPQTRPPPLPTSIRAPSPTLAVAPTPSNAEPPRPAAPVAADAPVSSAQLFAGIEGAASELTASDRPLAGAGMPSARARLPGSSEAIVDLPVQFKQRITPKQLSMMALRMVVGTMASNPDDIESASRMNSPLRDLTDAHIKGMPDPICNDPENPLRDPRCALPPGQ